MIRNSNSVFYLKQNETASGHIPSDPKDNDIWADLLQEGASRLGVFLGAEQIAAFNFFLRELKSWGSRINLIHRPTENDIILKDFLDSMTVLKFLPQGCSLADLGSGAGFPGIPIKITRPDIRVFLLESRQKRAFFLKNVVRTLKLGGIDILRPSEGIQHETFDFVVSRAFGSLRKLSSAAKPWLKTGGILLAMRGRRGLAELQGSLAFLTDQGWERDFAETVLLPFIEHRRVLVGLRKKCFT